MTSATRWSAPVALAIALGLAALSPPARAQDSLTRVLADVADVAMRGGDPYYGYGNNNVGRRPIVQRDGYGRPVYYPSAGGNGGHHDVDHGAGNGYSGGNGYGGSGYYGGNGYNGNGYYGGNGYNGGYNGNAYGTHQNGLARRDRGYRQSRQHEQRDRHERHDCQGHGQCDH